MRQRRTTAKLFSSPVRQAMLAMRFCWRRELVDQQTAFTSQQTEMLKQIFPTPSTCRISCLRR
jgi:hypothetical protein